MFYSKLRKNYEQKRFRKLKGKSDRRDALAISATSVQRKSRSFPKTELHFSLHEVIKEIFNANVGIDNATWKGVIGQHGDPDINKNGRCLLQFCVTNGLCIMNTFFQHKRIHKYTWYRDSLGQRSLIFVSFRRTCFLPCLMSVLKEGLSCQLITT